jgi:purine-binding chemotaxis protein CheW
MAAAGQSQPAAAPPSPTLPDGRQIFSNGASAPSSPYEHVLTDAPGQPFEPFEPFEPFALLPPTADSTASASEDDTEALGLAAAFEDGLVGDDGYAPAVSGAPTEDPLAGDLLAGLDASLDDDFLTALGVAPAVTEAAATPAVNHHLTSDFADLAPAPTDQGDFAEMPADDFALAASFFGESAVEEPVIEEPALDEPALDEPAVAEMAAEESAVEESLVDDSSSDAPLDLEEFIVFSLADTRCVVPIRNVVEVGRIPDAAAVPNAPAWLHGLGNLRGQVLSLIDLRAFLGLGRIRPSAGRMIVLRADADEIVAGLMVDQVHQIVSLSPARFQTAPATLPPGFGGFVWGVCDYGTHTMVGLDVDSVLGAEVEQAETTVLTV